MQYFFSPNPQASSTSTMIPPSLQELLTVLGPKQLIVQIKQSKTDSFRHGVTLWLGKTDCTICPVTGILPYLAARGPRPGSLFITSNRTCVTRQFFYSLLSTLLIRIGLPQKHFNTHSFRIGAVTSAKAAIYISKHWVGGEVMRTKHISRLHLQR